MSRNAHLKARFPHQALLVLGLSLFWLALPPAQAAPAFSPVPVTPRARVVTVYSPEATDAFRPQPQAIRRMVSRGLTNFTGKATLPEAWRSLVSTQEIVGIKVYSAPGSHSGTRPEVVAAVVEGLLAAGFPPNHIIIWDKQTISLRLAGFFELGERYGVRVAGSAEAGYDESVFYESPLLGNLVWGDLEFEKRGEGIGRKSFVSRLVSREMTKIINISPLLNHNYAGVAGNLYSLALGSVDNSLRFESDPRRLAEAVPDIYNLPPLNERVVLNIVDALVCQYEGTEHALLHYSTVLNQLRFSRDAVALDALSIQELERQRQLAKAPDVRPNLELYQNAATLLELGVCDPRKIQVEELR